MGNVLVACEESRVVCTAFRMMGHNAYSCDLQHCSGGHPYWHIMGDALSVIEGFCTFTTEDGITHYEMLWCDWDLIIAHPPCTDLASSGARWFKEKQADGRQERSINFFLEFTQIECPRVAIENPIGIMSTVYRKPDQIIQPWQFGHGETKATCLWLKGLPELTPTEIVEGREQKIWRMAPGPERAKLRSRTYTGIGEAMAKQWGCLFL